MKVMDLFAGCGGMSCGFMNAGFELMVAFDKWQAAVDVYQANFDHPIVQADLEQFAHYDELSQYDVDMIIGGPPCQDFSSAGKRDESLGRADLTITFADIIQHLQPQWFVMENVERIKNSYVLQEAKATLSDANYSLNEVILTASYYGVPQNRKRYFLIGELDGEDDALLPYLEEKLTETPMTVYDYLGDSLGIDHYYRHPRSYQRRGIFSIHEPSPTIRGVNRPVPKTYKKHPGDVAPVTSDLRPLTTIERSYIQTFPKTFDFFGTKTDLEQMIGNAVPVKLAEFVARCIQEYIYDRQHHDVKTMPNQQLRLFE